MKNAPIGLIFVLIIAACSHEHEILPHDHEIPSHEHPHDHDADAPVQIVSISDPEIYMPDVARNDNVNSMCSAKVNIVFSSTPLNVSVNAFINAYYIHGEPYENVVDRQVWWEQDRETVAIYCYMRTRWGVDTCKLEGVIQWHSGRKHFEVVLDKKIYQARPTMTPVCVCGLGILRVMRIMHRKEI